MNVCISSVVFLLTKGDHDSTADGHSLHTERWALRDVSSVRVGRRARPSAVAGAVWAAVCGERTGGGTSECRQPAAGAAARGVAGWSLDWER